MGVGVRSSELDMGLWSSDNPVGLEVDTAMSKPSSSSSKKPFHALAKKCVLEEKHMRRIRKLFQFLTEKKVRLPHLDEKACAFTHGQVCFYEATFLCGLQSPVHPFINELLGHLKIALSQLVPNAWRTVMSCMSIWTSVHEESIIKLNKFLFIYHLKPSTTIGILSFIRGIGNLELSMVILLPFMIGS